MGLLRLAYSLGTFFRSFNAFPPPVFHVFLDIYFFCSMQNSFIYKTDDHKQSVRRLPPGCHTPEGLLYLRRRPLGTRCIGSRYEQLPGLPIFGRNPITSCDPQSLGHRAVRTINLPGWVLCHVLTARTTRRPPPPTATPTHTHTHAHTSTHTCTRTHTHTDKNTDTHTLTHTHTHTHGHRHMHTLIHTHTHRHTDANTHTHRHTDVDTHTQTG